MTLHLIFNADDYGRTPDVSRGIREAHLRGLVTSTTCMMNLPGTARDIALALEETPRLGLGVHLTLTADSPLLPPASVPSLCDQAGRFLKLGQLIEMLGRIDVDEVRAEWRAQIEAFRRAAGRPPTHLDSHHHTSYFTPALMRTLFELADENLCAVRLPVMDRPSLRLTGLPQGITPMMQEPAARLVREIRPRGASGFLADFYDDQAVDKTLLDFIESREGGTWEVMCHPGFCTPDLEAVSSYARAREQELQVLTRPGLLEQIHARGIRLVTFEAC